MICAETPRFTLTTMSGAPVDSQVAFCGHTCEQMQRGPCAVCPPVCPFTPVMLLRPGETYSVAWNGTIVTAEDLRPGGLPADPRVLGRAHGAGAADRAGRSVPGGGMHGRRLLGVHR
jgi:hypothetical protein